VFREPTSALLFVVLELSLIFSYGTMILLLLLLLLAEIAQSV
jgi:hypothetical protein